MLAPVRVSLPEPSLNSASGRYRPSLIEPAKLVELVEARERTETPSSWPESVMTPPAPAKVLMATLGVPLKSNVPPLMTSAPS